jgi:hypothetical protein
MLYLAGHLPRKNDTVAPVQSDGRVVWRPMGPDVPGKLWTVHEEQVGGGPGPALAIARPSVTRPETLVTRNGREEPHPAGFAIKQKMCTGAPDSIQPRGSHEYSDPNRRGSHGHGATA